MVRPTHAPLLSRDRYTNLGCLLESSGRQRPGGSPGRDRWSEHFVFNGARIEGTSTTGRATVQVLAVKRCPASRSQAGTTEIRRLGLVLARRLLGFVCKRRL